MNIGERIKELRTQKGYTLEELGNMVGVGKSTIRKWETGMIANMKRDKIASLSKALGVTPDFFIDTDKYSEERAHDYAILRNDSSIQAIVECYKKRDMNVDMLLKYSELNKENKQIIDNMIEALSRKDNNIE